MAKLEGLPPRHRFILRNYQSDENPWFAYMLTPVLYNHCFDGLYPNLGYRIGFDREGRFDGFSILDIADSMKNLFREAVEAICGKGNPDATGGLTPPIFTMSLVDGMQYNCEDFEQLGSQVRRMCCPSSAISFVFPASGFKDRSAFSMILSRP